MKTCSIDARSPIANKFVPSCPPLSPELPVSELHEQLPIAKVSNARRLKLWLSKRKTLLSWSLYWYVLVTIICIMRQPPFQMFQNPLGLCSCTLGCFPSSLLCQSLSGLIQLQLCCAMLRLWSSQIVAHGLLHCQTVKSCFYLGGVNSGFPLFSLKGWQSAGFGSQPLWRFSVRNRHVDLRPTWRLNPQRDFNIFQQYNFNWTSWARSSCQWHPDRTLLLLPLRRLSAGPLPWPSQLCINASKATNSNKFLVMLWNRLTLIITARILLQAASVRLSALSKMWFLYVPMTYWQHLFHIIHTGSLLILDTLLSNFLSGSLVCQAT